MQTKKETLSELIHLRVTPTMKDRIGEVQQYLNEAGGLNLSEQEVTRGLISDSLKYKRIKEIQGAYNVDAT